NHVRAHLHGCYHHACGLCQSPAQATENRRRTKRMRKGITILLCGMFALSAPPAADRLWGQTERKEALPDPAVKVGDMAPDVTLQYGLYNPQYKAARRVNYVIDKSGKVVEMQIDNDAVDPTKIVTFCERHKTKE